MKVRKRERESPWASSAQCSWIGIIYSPVRTNWARLCKRDDIKHVRGRSRLKPDSIAAFPSGEGSVLYSGSHVRSPMISLNRHRQFIIVSLIARAKILHLRLTLLRVTRIFVRFNQFFSLNFTLMFSNKRRDCVGWRFIM